MKRLFSTLLPVAIGLTSTASPARPLPASLEGQPIVIGTQYSIDSRVLGDTMRINVYLPPDYKSDRSHAPIFYLLDGGVSEDFVHIVGLAQITSAYGQGDPAIVIGIEGVDRRHDLTSPSTQPSDLRAAPTSGGAAKYRRFLVEELQPWVVRHFPTTGRTSLMGESLAGLFVLETALREPNSFNDYIAVSPSLWWNNQALAREAQRDLNAPGFAGHRLWIGLDTGPVAETMPTQRAAEELLTVALRSHQIAAFKVHISAFPGETHGSVYHPAILEAFRAFNRPAF